VETRVGISGWRYPPWRGVFYPNKLAQHRELEYASRQVNSIELNGSFYSLQDAQSYKNWYTQTPPDFLFSVKGSRYITHIRRLKDVQIPLANFFASGILNLGEKLGPFLWQFAPKFLFRDDRIEEFFKLLPRTFGAAVRLMKKADRVEASFPAWAKNSDWPIRHAMEIRHPSFENPDFIDLLRAHNVALVFADTAGTWPYMEDLTADFCYLRLHGEEQIYTSGYDDVSLDWWAERIRLWRDGREAKDALTVSTKKPERIKRDIFAYFDNDVKVYAPFDAQRLYARVGPNAPKRLPKHAYISGATTNQPRQSWPGFR
jgi:uncharacterized protein YecE (DUF72 family)